MLPVKTPYDGWVDWGYHLGVGVRSMLDAGPDYVFVAVDYSGIELRGVDWLVGDEVGLQQDAAGIDKYIILAGSIYGVPPETIGKKDDRRSVGKEARLAGQYGIGWKTYRKRLKQKWGVDIDVAGAKRAIDVFRQSNYLIPAAWKSLEAAWRSACAGLPARACKCEFRVTNNWMTITAPDGRALYYFRPGSDISYEAVGKTVRVITMRCPNCGSTVDTVAAGGPCRSCNSTITKSEVNKADKKIRVEPLRKHLYGGALLENICQWISGNIAKDHAVIIEKKAPQFFELFQWAFFVHDENVAIVKKEDGQRALEFISHEMSQTPWYVRGLPLATEGFVSRLYKKG